MASLRELKTVYQIRYRDRSRDPSETTDSLPKGTGEGQYTEAEAEDEAQWRQMLYDRGKYDPWMQAEPGAAAVADRLTVGRAVQEYAEEKRRQGERGETGGWTQKTLRSTKPILEQFARYVGPGTLVRTLRPEHLRGWIYQERLSAASKRGRWVRLRAMLRFWEERSWASDLPRLPGKPEQPDRLKVTLRPEELETICSAYADLRRRKIAQNKHTTTAGVDWHPDAWRVCFFQGLRRSEVLEMRVRHLRLEEGLLRVGDAEFQQKGKRQSMIPLVDEAADVIEPYLQGRDRDERVFGTPSTNDRVSRQFREAVDHACLVHDVSPPDAAGVPFDPLTTYDASDIDYYTLRHSCCTYWLRQGRRLIWVNHLMRHRSIDTTMEYVHLLPTDLREMYVGLGGA